LKRKWTVLLKQGLGEMSSRSRYTGERERPHLERSLEKWCPCQRIRFSGQPSASYLTVLLKSTCFIIGTIIIILFT
jgi:hypothetical protein